MFSSLPKLADKAFIVGYLLPTLLFVAALALLFYDQQSVQKAISNEPQGWDKIVALVIGVWVTAVLLEFLNTDFIKILEGYSRPIKDWEFLRAKQLARFNSLDSRVKELLVKIEAGEPISVVEKTEFTRKSVELHRNFASDGIVLPTRLGNAIRAFERYGNEIYGADSVTLWGHLLSVVPKDFANALGEVKAQLDALVNFIFFAALFALISLSRAAYLLLPPGRGNVSPDLDQQSVQIIIFIFAAVAAVGLALGAYALAIRKVYAWGAYVKAAFDNYLPDLAKKLGFQMPTTIEKQRRLWAKISQRVAYHRPFDPEPWMLLQPEIEPGPGPNDGGSNPSGVAEVAPEKRKADDSEDNDPDGNGEGEDGDGGGGGGGDRDGDKP
jgi:hypothetical protein